MESRQLRYFAAVAEAGSFTAAAAQLRIAQPALSRQIATLERDIGSVLFLRKPGGVTLTPAGEILQRHAEAIRLQAARAREEIADAGGDAAGWLSLGTAPSTGRQIFGPVADAMAMRFPRLRMSFVEGVGAHLLAGVTDGTLDLAISPRPAYAPGIAFRHLLSEPVYLVAAATRAMPTGAADWDDLDGLPLVVTNQQTTVASWVEELSGLARTLLDLRYRVESAHAAVDIVSRGLAYGVLPKSVLDELGADRPLQTQRLRGVTLERHLAWARGRAESAAFVALRDIVTEAMASTFGRPEASSSGNAKMA
jgi:LysR family nitrogen assimilation transcriptional regulator